MLKFINYLGKLFWVYFRLLLIYLAFRKWKKDCHILVLKIILVQGFCLLKTEIAGLCIGFHVKHLLGENDLYIVEVKNKMHCYVKLLLFVC